MALHYTAAHTAPPEPCVMSTATAVINELPLPERLLRWPRAASTTLARCLWLAVLLHTLLLLWLGTAPEGTAPPGQGSGGRLNVTLRGPSDDGVPSAPPPQPVAPRVADTQAQPRIGGQVREAPPPVEASPGAAPAPQAPALPSVLPPVLPSAPALALPTPAAPSLTPTPPAPLALPTLAPLPAAAPTERTLDATPLRQLVPTPSAPLLPAAPPAAALPTLPSLGELGAAPAAAATAAPPSPVAAPLTTLSATLSATPSTAHSASPADSGPRPGADVAVPPSAAASAPKRLNLELGRLRGGELSRHSTMGVLPALPRPPESDKLAKDIEKTGRADCREAHAGAGILAVVPLAVDTVRGKGCKW
jgi:hypothetical protein